MFFTLLDYIGMALVVLLVIVWLFFYRIGEQYTDMFAGLNEKDYPLKDLYGIGYALMEMIHYPYKARWDRDIRTDLSVLYTEKYAEYYLRVLYAQTVTINSIVLICMACMALIAGEVVVIFMAIIFMAVFTYYFMTLPATKIQKRSDELITDYAEVVSNLALLTNAGMILREAWAEVAYSNDGTFYKEMQMVVQDLNNGVGEEEAFHKFGIRCVIPEAKKFASIITQGIQKGNSELAKDLQIQSVEVWEQKKQLVKRQGEKAANRLIIPTFLMFGGILVMIIIPIFANMF